MRALEPAAVMVSELVWLGELARAKRRRGIREWAESEIVLPDGPYQGQRFRVSRQPVAGLWLDALDEGRYRRYCLVGSTQSGKTLVGSIMPLMYCLFELEETFIYGVPKLEMMKDKWEIDIKPVIQASRYRELIPDVGAGSRGGVPGLMRFRNGAALRFMTGGGDDKTVAGFTARCLGITEVDGMDTAGETSREADRITQLEARTKAFDDRARVYMECTASTSRGRIWREYRAGTAHVPWGRCPHCGEWVRLEPETREECALYLTGWEQARDETEAYEGAGWRCPGCAEPWTEAERRAVVTGAVLVGEGQRIEVLRAPSAPDGSSAFAEDDGGKEGSRLDPPLSRRAGAGATGESKGQQPLVSGEGKRTFTFSMRYGAVSNLLVRAGTHGVLEWRKRHDLVGEDDREAELCQFQWALPWDGNAEAEVSLEVRDILERGQGAGAPGLAEGVAPSDTVGVTAGLDMGKHTCHWVMGAWRPEGSVHVVRYGELGPAWRSLGVEKAFEVTIGEFWEECGAGAARAETGEVLPVRVGLVDARYQPDSVYAGCRAAGMSLRPPAGLIPSFGYGAAADLAGQYSGPRTTGQVVRAIGPGYHCIRLKDLRTLRVEVNVDPWKSWVHSGLSMPVEEAGAITLFGTRDPLGHLRFAKHLLSERREQRFDAKKGKLVDAWVRGSRANHWFDAMVLMVVAGRICGWTRKRSVPPAAAGGGGQAGTRVPPSAGMTGPLPGGGERPYLVTER